jgi:hypothetical protein
VRAANAVVAAKHVHWRRWHACYHPRAQGHAVGVGLVGLSRMAVEGVAGLLHKELADKQKHPSSLSKPMQPSTSRVVVVSLALLTTSSCVLRAPTLSRSHEVAFGIGGAGHLLTEPESSGEPRYGAGAALAWRASYARCLDKGKSQVCFEVPLDGIPAATIASPNPRAPRSFSTLALTPGLRFESNQLPGGFLPLNFIAIGLGAARYVSSSTLLDGTMTAEPERATTVGIRVDLGLKVRLRERVGLRVGVFAADGDLPTWFQQLGNVVPEGSDLGDVRLGGYGVLYIRR